MDHLAGDGVYSYKLDDGSIELTNVNSNTTKYLVRGTDLLDVSLAFLPSISNSFFTYFFLLLLTFSLAKYSNRNMELN